MGILTSLPGRVEFCAPSWLPTQGISEEESSAMAERGLKLRTPASQPTRQVSTQKLK